MAVSPREQQGRRNVLQYMYKQRSSILGDVKPESWDKSVTEQSKKAASLGGLLSSR